MNRATVLLVLVLASLLTIIAVQLRAGARPVDSVPMRAQGSGRDEPAAGELPDRSLPPLASLSETTARPLFSESRRPAFDAPAPVEAAPAGAKPGPDFTISAIVLTETERAVLVNHPDTGTTVRLVEGETIAGWTLEKIEPDRAVFSKAGESQSAVLRTFGPPIVKRTAPRAAAGPVPSPRDKNAGPVPPRRTPVAPSARRPGS